MDFISRGQYSKDPVSPKLIGCLLQHEDLRHSDLAIICSFKSKIILTEIESAYFYFNECYIS